MAEIQPLNGLGQENPHPYTPLLADRRPTVSSPQRRPIQVLASVLLAVVGLSGLLVICKIQSSRQPLVLEKKDDRPEPLAFWPVSRGKPEGVSEKASLIWPSPSFTWTNAMLAWQRTSYHFQPEKNWMNGPLFYMGWYHLFYQYNPDSAVWGNITWGHAVSKDLIHWLYLDLAMVPDQWYDINGVWTGSATLLPDGRIVMIYTGSTNESVQVQNVAVPANLSDPLLRDWVKYEANPVLLPPRGILYDDFRDPTTAWFAKDGKAWYLTIGSKVNTTGIALVYKTTDFYNYELMEGVLHSVPETGMWECIDFYPVSTTSTVGLDTSSNETDVKYVLKASLDDLKKDFYALGSYDEANQTWTPDDLEMDVGIGMRYDYGKYYASKTFYDQYKGRRILWGWISETDSEETDLEKGWASLQTIPRVVYLDLKTNSNLIQWPVEEVKRLRRTEFSFENITVAAGSVLPLNITPATQLDINIEMEFPYSENITEADVTYNCTTSGGAADRGILGPFGLLIFADDNLVEQTAVFFYVAKASTGDFRTYFCHDDSRSSKATDLVGYTYGNTVPVLSGEKLSIRILVDHSIIESFAQGGRMSITSRVYPTEAIYGAARVFLFNNASVPITTTSLNIWQMDSAHIHPFFS
ncbi:beta-fructofuranosidase, soluble isoenzyme I-like isoform X2 [Nymphaea colorata]|uniref:beta-fructofuranosidase, soluble isoenzyme I-like isoform X2 n=1 Tax=Nymphaea colorata TaxID=210225 RepID=UPI00162C3EAB|nr:beta-fructofuranosidase, soluble isoenzyme I-like isoform X2 [Nymphaea colorata]